MLQTQLQHSSDVFEVYILVTVGKCYSPTYNSKLFSFVYCLPSVLLYVSSSRPFGIYIFSLVSLQPSSLYTCFA